jgi:hypothetical protein
MTMDLYGHLVDGNLWQPRGSSGASEPSRHRDSGDGEAEADEGAW